jgi:hypothetical protein
MNTYIWKISSLDCVSDGESKVVYCIHWRINGDDAVNTAEIYGKQSIEKNTKNTFIAYEDLTEAEVITWLQETMGEDVVTKLQESLDKQLENLANPPVVNLPLPWTVSNI